MLRKAALNRGIPALDTKKLNCATLRGNLSNQWNCQYSDVVNTKTSLNCFVTKRRLQRKFAIGFLKSDSQKSLSRHSSEKCINWFDSCPSEVAYMYAVRQKTVQFYFCNNFVKYYYTGIIIGEHIPPNKFGTKWHQNLQSYLKDDVILPCEMQHSYTCYDQRRFCHVS